MSAGEVADILTSQRYHSTKLNCCVSSQNASGLTGFQHTMLSYSKDGLSVECSYYHYLPKTFIYITAIILLDHFLRDCRFRMYVNLNPSAFACCSTSVFPFSVSDVGG